MQHGQSPVPYYRAEGAGASRSARPPASAGWRRALALTLVIAGCLAAPAALAAGYVHRDIMNADGYVATVTPLAADPAVQKAVADVLAKQVSHALDAGQALPGPLPSVLGAFTGPLSTQLEGLTRKLTLQAVESSAFRRFWATANRAAHPVLVDAIKGKGKVTAKGLVGLDLSGVTAAVTGLLTSSGVSLPEPLPKALTSGDVMLLDARPLARVGSVILALDSLYPVLLLLVVALLVASVVVAPARLRATVFVGAGLALAMLALQAGLAVGRLRYLGATDDAHIPHAASAAIWGALTGDLRRWGWAVLVVGLAVGVTALLVSLVLRRGEDSPRQQSAPRYADYLYLPGEAPHPGGVSSPGTMPSPPGRGYGPTGPPPRR
jgi:hypothetical protein